MNGILGEAFFSGEEKEKANGKGGPEEDRISAALYGDEKSSLSGKLPESSQFVIFGERRLLMDKLSV